MYGSDAAGNQSALLPCGPDAAPSLLIGSHLDSVPQGGRFDGALGVVCALEVLSAVKQSGLRLGCNLEAVGFSDEEGAHLALLGSRAMSGMLPLEELQRHAGMAAGFDQDLACLGLERQGILRARRDPSGLAGYLELHVEQGAVLETAGVDIGVVTGFVGIRAFKFTFIGRADHAGATPMDQRRDPVPAACAFTLAVREAVMAEFAPGVVTVGEMEFSPGAFNVVPDSVKVWLEFRAPNEETLDRMQERIVWLAGQKADSHEAGLEVRQVEKVLSVETAPQMRQAIHSAVQRLGLSSKAMPSGAGHDAQSLAQICPAGLIFVPSRGGASHSPRESTAWSDCINGAQVLLRAALGFCPRD